MPLKAVVYDAYGPPDVLHIEDVERPVPKADEVLIKVHATTINRLDVHTREANRAEIDGFELAKLLKAVLRHHAAGPRVHFAAPIEGLPLKRIPAAATGAEQLGGSCWA